MVGDDAGALIACWLGPELVVVPDEELVGAGVDAGALLGSLEGWPANCEGWPP